MDSTEERDGAKPVDAQPAETQGTNAASAEAGPASAPAGLRPEEGAGQGPDVPDDVKAELKAGEPEAGSAVATAGSEERAAGEQPLAPSGEPGVGAERDAAAPEAEPPKEAAGESEEIETGIEERPEPVPLQIPHFPEPPRKRHHVAPALVALDQVLEDETFRIRPQGDVSLLATDIARLGQLFPVDLRLVPPNGFQVISGFRRVAALRFLQRDKVLARLHTDVDDEDALLMALAAAIHSVPVAPEQLTELKDRLERENRLSAAARDMLEKALTVGEALAPEGPVVEVDADELAVDVTRRLGAINQDLALLADVFGSLDEAQRAELLDQLRYSSELVAFLEGQG